MLFTFGLKFTVHNKFKESLKKQNISFAEISSTPTILNSVLWSAIACNDSTLYIGEYSFLKDQEEVSWILYERNLSLLDDFKSEPVEVLKWFSDDAYFVKPESNDTLAFYSVKFGRLSFESEDPETAFKFYFKLFRSNGKVNYYEVRPDNISFLQTYHSLLKRIGI